MVLKLKGVAAALLSLHSQPFFQPEEFDRSWKDVWSAYYERDEDFDDFMNYFIKSVCVPPKYLAVEDEPLDLFVCAERCGEWEMPTLSVHANGTRMRRCVPAVFAPPRAPPPVAPSPVSKKKKKKRAR